MEIRLDSPSNFKTIRTDDGRLVCEGAFCRDGILEYRRADGSVVRELRRPQTNSSPKTVDGFKMLPIVVEHPPSGLLNSANYKQFAVGMTDSSAHYDSSFGGILGLVSMYDREAINYADSGEKVELSAGYGCDIIDKPGVWNGSRYDREQINIRPNHIALTAKGRAGTDVGLRLDSEDGIGIALSEGGQESMAKVVCDSVEYDNIPEVFASVAGRKIAELDQLLARIDSMESDLQQLQSRLNDAEEDQMRLQGRCDGLEIIVDNADLVCDSLGFFRNEDGQYVYRGDSDNSYKDDDEAEETTDMNDAQEFEPKGGMKRGKGKKKKSHSSPIDDEYEAEEKTDSVGDILNVWKQCNLLVPGFSDQHFDSSYSATEVKQVFLESIDPEIDFSNVRSDSYIDGVFAYAVNSLTGDEERYDSSEELDQVINAQRNDSYNYSSQGIEEDGLYDFERERANNYKKNMTMSKSQFLGGS